MLKNEYSLTEKVYQNLRSDILSGTFRDQEELRETALAKTYGVSRTPVREAIRPAGVGGPCGYDPEQGRLCTQYSWQRCEGCLCDSFTSGGPGGRWAVENITDEQIEAMEEVLYMSEYYRKKELWEQVYRCDNQFHDLMYAASGSHLLEHMLRTFHEYVQQVRKSALQNEKRAKSSFEEHAAILEAIKKGRADEAADLAKQHIDNAVESWKSTDAIHAVE